MNIDTKTWTPQYVRDNYKNCLGFLLDVNKQTKAYLLAGNCTEAIRSFDTAINGFVACQNSGCANFRPYMTFLSMAEGKVMAFNDIAVNGTHALESKRRETALDLFKDAYDFASSDAAKNLAKIYIEALEDKDLSLDDIAEATEFTMPDDPISDIDEMNVHLEKLWNEAPARVTGGRPSGGSSAGCLGTIMTLAAFVLAVTAVLSFIF